MSLPRNPHRWGKRQLWLMLIMAATFVLYFTFGLFYVSHNAERLKSSGDLSLRGEAYLQGFITWGADLEADDAYYNRSALGIMQTGMPRDRDGNLAFHAPLYSFFVAACYGIGGFNRYSLATGQSVLAALLALFGGLTAGRLAPERAPAVGFLGAGLVMCNLLLAKWTAIVAPTLLLLLWFSIVLYLAAGRLRTAEVLGLALVAVLAVFTQAAFFVVASGVCLWLAWCFVRERRLCFALGCLVTLSGVAGYLGLAASAARAGVTHKANKSMILWEANNPYYESLSPFSLWGRRPSNPYSDWEPSPDERKRYEEYFSRAEKVGHNPALLWIRENPGKYVKLCWIRLYTTLGPITGQMSWRNKALSTVYWLLIVPAGLLGLWQLRRQPFASLAALVFLALTTFEVLVITDWQLRYRLPWMLILLCSSSVFYSWLVFARSTTSRLPTPLNQRHQASPHG